MAKSTGKSLVIVESPAKARTISKFLGKNYQVEASIGHVRDLPGGKKEIPEKYKSEEWAYLGVNVNDGFEPVYIVPDDKKKQVKKLKDALKDCDQLYLATDEDREGEAISWHLQELLKPKVPVHRLVFHEITKEAIESALASPREIDTGLVNAQETRRILDRLYGYDVSQLLWRKIGRGLSAGRVQSVAVRLIVERERERMAFHSASYWDLEAVFETGKPQSFPATLVSVGGRKIPTGKDFDADTGKLKNPELLQMDQAAAEALATRLNEVSFRVSRVDFKPFTERPKAPFTTSTMQQEANRKLGLTARNAMRAAQKLYENGFITYMRTDSTTLSKEAINAARTLVTSEYGENFLHPEVRTYASKVKNAQEAHEAIRPAGTTFRKPESLRDELNRDEFRLYDLIWKRTVACQMADAKKRRTTIVIEGGDARFQASGTSIEFEGFLRAYVEGSDDPEAELADKETLLPAVNENDPLKALDLNPKDHTTKPPSRFSEAALTRILEEKGIGRPSTYASIIETIQARDYVYKKGGALVPSWTAFSVVRMLETHFFALVDYEFTAQMEDFLDAISRHEAERLKYLDAFYFGGNESEIGLKPRLAAKVDEIDPRETAMFSMGTPEEGEHREEVFVRVGKFGPFLEQGERRGSIPDGLPPDELTLTLALELLESSSRDDEPLGTHEETGKPIYLKNGRFGPYVQLGENDDDEKKNKSIPKMIQVDDVTLELAHQLLALPRDLGPYEELDATIEANDGRYGPYIRCGKETRSLPEGVSPMAVTREQAIELLKQPKTRGRAAAKEPLKVFDAPSPVTEKPIRVLEGRYGPYVNDGETNASLRKGMVPEELTLNEALDLLAERAAAAPKKKKKAAKKKAAKKKTAKKTAKKKTAKKKAAKKKTAAAKGVKKRP